MSHLNFLLNLAKFIKSNPSLKDKKEACLRNWIGFLDQPSSKDDFLRLKSETKKLFSKYFGSKTVSKCLEKVRWTDIDPAIRNPNPAHLKELISAIGKVLGNNQDEISDMLHKTQSEQIDWSKHLSFF